MSASDVIITQRGPAPRLAVPARVHVAPVLAAPPEVVEPHLFDPGPGVTPPPRRPGARAEARRLGFPTQCQRWGCWGWYDDPRHIGQD